jgi:hypothetical protein
VLQIDDQHARDLYRDLPSGVLLDKRECRSMPEVTPGELPDLSIANNNGIRLDS